MSKFPADLFGDATSGSGVLFRGLVPYSMNEMLAFFSDVFIADDPGGFDSITNPANWTIAAIDPRVPSEADPGRFFVPDGVGVPTFQPEIGVITADEDDDLQIHVRCNRPLEARVIYELTVLTAARTAACDTIFGDDTKSAQGLFRGVGPVPRFVQEDIYRDFDLRYFPTDPKQPPSTWRYDSTGDIGIQTGLESLRKRLYRRLTTAPGGFKHLGDAYGVDVGIKTLARSGELQKLANRAAAQAREEPDVTAAGAQTRLVFASDGSALIELSIQVVQRGREQARFVFNLPATSSID